MSWFGKVLSSGLSRESYANNTLKFLDVVAAAVAAFCQTNTTSQTTFASTTLSVSFAEMASMANPANTCMSGIICKQSVLSSVIRLHVSMNVIAVVGVVR